jgi:hypothetical protein
MPQADKVFDRFVHSMELMIGRRLLLSNGGSIIVEHDEIQDKIEKTALVEDPFEQNFEFY